MNAQLIALMTEYSIKAKGMAKLFGVTKRTVDGWRSSPDNPNYRSMDRSPNKATYRLRLKWIARYLAQVKEMKA